MESDKRRSLPVVRSLLPPQNFDGGENGPASDRSEHHGLLDQIPEDEPAPFDVEAEHKDPPAKKAFEKDPDESIEDEEQNAPPMQKENEDDKLLRQKSQVGLPENANALFYRRSYSHIERKAEEKQFEDFKPILKVNNNKALPRTGTKKLVDFDPDEDEKPEEKRKRTIKGRQQKIGEARAAVAQTKIDNYAERFNEDAKNDAVLLAEVNMEVLRDENAKLEARKGEKEEKERKIYSRYKLDQKTLREESKAEQLHRGELMRKQLERTELESIEKTKEKRAQMRASFASVGHTLGRYLGEAKGEVRRKYKDIIISDKEERHNLTGEAHAAGEVGGEEEQVVEMRLEIARCVKDKLPKGRYAILCSVLDHIGGSVIDYQAEKSKKWRRITAPKTHSGEYHLNNLRFEKSLLMIAPKRSEVRPSMVYLFELFLLKSKDFSHDQVLGWGVFPLINAEFELNKGNFKIPLLFGPVDSSFDKYVDIEKKYRTSIDSWLCNLYFSIRRKDSVPDRYVTQLFLDEDTQSRHAKCLESLDRQTQDQQTTKDDESKPTPSFSRKHNDLSYAELPGGEQEANSQEAGSPQKLVEKANSLASADSAESRHPHLTKPRHFDSYTYHLPHIELKSGAIVSQKLLYIMDEAMSDLGFRNVKSVNFWISLVVLLAAMWIRSYMHTFGSWILLKMAGVAVNRFDPMIYGFALEYSTRNVGVELGVLLFGNLFNTLLFGILIAMSWGFQRMVRRAPRMVYKVVASYGIAVIFDFVLIGLIDLIRLNWDGEVFVLTRYYNRSSNSGVIGAAITILIYGALLVLNTFIFYNYLVFLHMEGRIIDIYSRVTANASYFFIPFDNEVSARYLRWVIAKVKHENAVSHNTKHAAITSHTVIDTSVKFLRKITHISIYRRREDGKLVLYRHFVKSDDGAICELEEGIPFTVDEHPLLESWPEHSRQFLGSEEPSVMAGEEGKRQGDIRLPLPGKESNADIQGAYKLEMSADSPFGMRGNHNSSSMLQEPQMFMIKND